MYTAILRKMIKSINKSTGHCDTGGGGSIGHCY